MTVRVVVVGTGFGARVVAPVFSATPGCAVVEVVSARDPNAIRASITNERPDLVTVHSPPFLHDEHVRVALEMGVATVMCDKPFTPTEGVSFALRDAAHAAGIRHLVNFEFRCDPGRERLRAMVRDGAIGRVERVAWSHWSNASRVPMRRYGWLFDADRGGGFIGAWGSHAVDTLRWLLDDEFDVLTNTSSTVIGARSGDDGAWHHCSAEDSFTATMRSRLGRVEVVLDATFAASASLAPRLVVGGTDGVLELVADQRIVRRAFDGTYEVTEIDFEPPAASGSASAGGRTDAVADRHLVPMQRWATRVRDLITNGIDIPGVPTFDDGLACDRVLEALRRAAAPPSPSR